MAPALHGKPWAQWPAKRLFFSYYIIFFAKNNFFFIFANKTNKNINYISIFLHFEYLFIYLNKLLLFLFIIYNQLYIRFSMNLLILIFI